MSKVMIISADGHAALPLADYRPYIGAEHLTAFDELVADEAAQVTIDFFDVLDPDLARRYKTAMYDSGVIACQRDPKVRIDVLHSEGIVGELLFPDGAPFGAGGLGSARQSFDPALERAGAQAYNRWIVEFCATDPGLGAQAIVSLYDVAGAIEDVTWAAEHGAKAVFMPGMDNDRPLYWDPVYEPFWSACEELGLPLNFHGGTGMPNYRGDTSDVPYEVRARLSGFEFPFWAHRPLWFMLWSGVLERHPDLHLVFTEQHSDWVSESVAKMDHSWHHGMWDNRIREIVPRPPSEYYARQIWLGSSLLARGEMLTRSEIGIDKLMFGADFPHPEGTYGVTREYLRATVGAAAMSEPEIRAVLGGNAAARFGFDVDVLAPVAEEHGLTLEEITEPLPEAQEHELRHLNVLRPTTGLTPLR